MHHPHLGPPKARIMSISWKPWASLGAPSPADAHDARACGAHHEGRQQHHRICWRCTAPSKNITPRGTRARFAPQGRASRASAGPPRRSGGVSAAMIKASPLRLRQALAPTAAPTEAARGAARFNGCRQCRRPPVLQCCCADQHEQCGV